ncbi:threonine/serine ThrE exporter family protein [Propionicicella superfundia]|uniref:threonine/serine ThrE exporter family protein n=1 Tax=Propionicicella superfundia TaxID=348582 RepID=UPI000426DBC5|nr:threonine/serine exporter family protein [Propionicicella superfundia]
MNSAGSPVSPDRVLAEKSDAVCRMGSLMLSSGTGSYRVKAAMGRVAEALGIDQLEAQVSLTEIVATTRAHGTFRTQVVEVPAPVVNADRIEELMRVSLRASPGLTAAGLQGKLDDVEARRGLYPPVAVVTGAAVACAAFAFLNNGGWLECVAAGLAAGLGKSVHLAVRRLRLNQLATVAIAAVTACALFLLVSQAIPWLFPGVTTTAHEAAFISAVLFLVPGFPLLTAALDLARFDFTSGVSRLLYAGMITLAASLGVWLVAWAFTIDPAELPAAALPLWLLLPLHLLTSFLGVFGFAVTFNTPPRAGLAAGAIGAVANTARLAAVDAGWNPLLCALVATTVIGLLAGWASQRILSPRIILSVPAVLIMIPGVSTYRAVVSSIDRDPVNALTYAMTSIAVLTALAGGLAVARMLTDPAWIAANPTWTRMPRTRAQRTLRDDDR